MHSFRRIIEGTEKLKQLSGNFPGGGAFSAVWGGGGIFQKFSKN